MNFFYLLLGGLATYRISLLISKEDGPAYVFRRLRRQAPNTSLREGLSCEWCMSIWAGALVATYYWWISIVPGREWPLYWLAMSALGIICNQQWNTGRSGGANAPQIPIAAQDAATAGDGHQDKATADKS